MSTRVILPRKAFKQVMITGADLGGGWRGCAPTPRDDPRFSYTTGILQKKTVWFIGVEVEQETSAPPPKKKILDPPLDKIIIHKRLHSVDQPPSQPGSQSVSWEVRGGGGAGTE